MIAATMLTLANLYDPSNLLEIACSGCERRLNRMAISYLSHVALLFLGDEADCTPMNQYDPTPNKIANRHKVAR